MSNARPYKVVVQGTPHLVKAISREQAISRVTRPLVDSIEVADGLTVAEMLGDGVQMVDATTPEPEATEEQ